MKTSKAGLKFIQKWEGTSLKAYNDVAGHLTIGTGHLLMPIELKKGNLITGVNWRDGISKKQAMDLLIHDVEHAETAVNELITVPLSQHQFDALVSFTFNLGRARLDSSKLRTKLNQGDYAGVPGELKKWRKAGGKVVKGLVNRRRAEGALWRSNSVKPVVKSRTNHGAAIAATGQVINVIAEATEIKQATSGIAQTFGENAQWVSIGLTFIGVAYVIYARWDDRRNGIK